MDEREEAAVAESDEAAESAIEESPASEPAEEVVVAEPVAPPAEVQRWLLAGPAGSGRSAFLGAMARACALYPTDERVFDLRPENEAAETVFGEATRRFMGELRDEAPERAALTFSMGVGPAGTARRRGPVAVTVEQVAGWSFPPPLRVRRDRKRLPESEVLVLLVPPRDLSHAGGGESGRVRSVAAELDDGLAALATMRRAQAASRSWWPFGGSGSRAGRKVLPFRRVLVLVSMVDRVATELLSRGEAARAAGFPRGASPTARELVEEMVPLSAARHYAGDGFLVALLGQVDPACRVAVGLVSASGFRASGEAMVDGRGRFTAGGSGLRFEQDATAQTTVLREWAPYGMRAALAFAATGELLAGEPIEEISMDQFDPRDAGGE